MNILIAQDATTASNFRLDGWATCISHFGGQRLLNVIATLLMVQNDVDNGESYDEAIGETIDQLIGAQSDRRMQAGSPRDITESEREEITQYLKRSVKALRGYMPSGGSLELVTYATDAKHEVMYLVVRYHPEDECSVKAFAGPSIRA